ncbi:hypothetical protein MBLNU230_g4344t1 [Neophaeotheca triangularis]
MVKHTWTPDERLAILCICDVYDNYDQDAAARIFNRMYGTDLSKQTVKMQYSERTRLHRSPSWTAVWTRLETNQGKRDRELMEGRVRQAAVALGIPPPAMGAASSSSRVASAPSVNGHSASSSTDYAAGTPSPPPTTQATSTTRQSKPPSAGEPLTNSRDQAPLHFPALSATMPTPTTATTTSSLPMVHHTHCIWRNDRFAFTDAWNSTIPTHTDIYKHGGRVHALTTLSTSTPLDAMICSQDFCPECRRHSSSHASPATPSETAGRPFVHAGDLRVCGDGGGYRFEPERPRSHNLGIEGVGGFAVVGFGGGVETVVAVCARGCGVCGGGLRRG